MKKKKRNTSNVYGPKTRKKYEADGYAFCKTEYWQATPFSDVRPGVRKDLFGFIDALALHPDLNGVLGIQYTSRSNMSARKKKAMTSPFWNLWMKPIICPHCGKVAGGNRFTILGWEQMENRRWRCHEREIQGPPPEECD